MDSGRTSLAVRVLGLTLALDAFWVAAYLGLFAMGSAGARLLAVLDLDAEANPPSWWSGSQLLIIGLVLLVLVVRPFADHPRVRPIRPALWCIGAGFVFLSADEIGSIHENLTGVLRDITIVPGFRGEGMWMFVYGVIGVVVVAVLARYGVKAWTLWRRQLLLALGGFGLIVAGAVVTEILGYFMSPSGWAIHLEIAVEELAEMVGASVVLYAVMQMIAEVGNDLLARRVTSDEVSGG